MRQKDVIVNSAVWHEKTGRLLEACRLYVLLLKAYPDTVTYYGTHAAELALRCEKIQHGPISECNKYRKLFVEDILDPILHQKVVIYDDICLPSDIKIFDPLKDTHIPISIPISPQSNYPINFNVTHKLLKSWLERAQGFYISRKEWRKVFEVSFTVMGSCGILKFESGPKTKLIAVFDDPKQLPLRVFEILNKKSLTVMNNNLTYMDTKPHPFSLSIGISCFVHCCHEFYQFVAGLKSKKRTCLTPVCLIGQFNTTAFSSTLMSSNMASTSYSHHLSYDEASNSRASKRQRIDYLLTESQVDNNDCIHESCKIGGLSKKNKETIHESPRGKDMMNVRNLLINNDEPEEIHQKDDSLVIIENEWVLDPELPKLVKNWEETYNSTEEYINEAISYRERALGCWQLCVSMVERMGEGPQFLDQELGRLTKEWNLPLDISSAIMLTRGDGALSDGKLNLADVFYRKICSQISDAWDEHRKKGIKHERKSTLSKLLRAHLSSQIDEVDSEIVDETFIKEQIPVLLFYRVLYSISSLYLAIDWWAQARVELCIILATIPFTPVMREHFEKDDWEIERNRKACDGHKREKFKWTEVTQEDLVVRAIKELMICFMNELREGSNDQIDKTLGNMIVLSQYGWPYWRDRTFRPLILQIIKKRGGLNYPDLFRFVNNVYVLREILDLHKALPDLKFSFCSLSSNNSSSSSLSPSIQGLEDRIRYPSCFINESLMEFYRERFEEESFISNSDGSINTSGLGVFN